MWNSVANLKESLNQIANGVHNDDDEELSMYTPPRGRDRFSNGISFSEKRISSDFSGSVGQTGSPLQIEHYTAEIKRLQESEAEIKALSVNYAALLKEKEDQISKLSQENDALKENLITTNAALVASKTRFKENGDISPTRDHKAVAKIRGSGRLLSDGNLPKNNGLSSGTTSDNAKDTLRTVGVKDRSIPVIQQAHEAQIKELTMELDKERGKLSSMEIRLQEEQKLNGSLQLELNLLKEENNKISSKVHRVFDELNQKALEIGRLQTELQGKNQEQTQGTLENLKKVITRLEDENRNIKKEKADIEAALKVARPYPAQGGVPADVDSSNMQSDSVDGASQREEEMRQSLRKLERDLQEASRERDKARKELNRLKQHLLEKESEESEKMDEDSKIIEELRAVNEQQRTQISHLERTVKQANDRQEEMKMFQTTELMKAKENISELDKKLSSCLSTIHAKNTEIHNLQMALGQYYAEIEAKVRLAEELSVRKEELARLSSRLQEILQQAEASNMEKEQILGKLSQAEKILSDGKKRANKLEEDNEKLRRALEQSMTRLNRMSVDSDFLVDRRIVIKLLVTYFQRNHSKEVLDLMVRMLGFSAEDKQRIGIAQQGSGKGLVRGVFGLPGRLVGGMLSSGPSEANATMTSDNQSFADLWVDFLLKENERERSESGGPLNGSTPTHKPTGANSPLTSNRGSTSSPPDLSIPNPYLYQTQMAPSSHGNVLQRES